MDDEWDDEESPKSRTGRFMLPHRGGARVEVGEPVHIGGPRPWLCVVKLMGKDDPHDNESTQTLFVRSGRGATPEEAQRDALAQLSLVYGSPVGPAPNTQISKKLSEPPPSERRLPAAGSTVPPPPSSGTRSESGFLAKLLGKKQGT